MDDSGQYSALGHPIKRYLQDQQEHSPAPQDQDYQEQMRLFEQRQKQNHALLDYQMQLMLLESQNKKRLLMARQEQESLGLNPAPGQSGD